ncbi:hypothetical protein [Neisseria yangbaofengii]|uniref:hypothetical protein n=1 Tax=Neisseria yangbaofengii TaxID=2709396 RepID=UPI0013EDA346|nr:hypothetical protein [Neisseria yangbaofengii]
MRELAIRDLEIVFGGQDKYESIVGKIGEFIGQRVGVATGLMSGTFTGAAGGALYLNATSTAMALGGLIAYLIFIVILKGKRHNLRRYIFFFQTAFFYFQAV